MAFRTASRSLASRFWQQARMQNNRAAVRATKKPRVSGAFEARPARFERVSQPGSVKPRRKTAGSVVNLGASPAFDIGEPEKGGQIHRYQSPDAIRRQCPGDRRNALGFGGPYSNYQGPSFAHFTMITSSSTAVSGYGADPGAGGIVRAIIPRSSFRRYDYTGVEASGQLRGYADPNVPCGHPRPAVWWFGDGNPTPTQGQKHLYGWVAVRLAAPREPDPDADPNYVKDSGKIVCQ
jgi:hypothetical protein